MNAKTQPEDVFQPPFLQREAFDFMLSASPFEAFNSLFKIWAKTQQEVMEHATQASQTWLSLVTELQADPPKTARKLAQSLVSAQRRGFEEWRQEMRAINDATARCAYETASCASEMLPDTSLDDAMSETERPQATQPPLRSAA